jgi:ABC-type lipoprotein release transport system permease subunit
VRVALGASSRRIITSIFRRPLIQVAIGVVVGTVLVGFGAIGIQNTEQFRGIRPPGLTVTEVLLLAVHATLMLGVCTLACVVPTARALRVQPTEALRAE